MSPSGQLDLLKAFYNRIIKIFGVLYVIKLNGRSLKMLVDEE